MCVGIWRMQCGKGDVTGEQVENVFQVSDEHNERTMGIERLGREEDHSRSVILYYIPYHSLSVYLF